MKNDKFCISKELFLSVLLILVVILTYPIVFSSRKLSYKSSAATTTQTISPTPPLTSNPEAVLSYWIDFDSKKFPVFSDQNEINMLQDYIFNQKKVKNFYGNQQNYQLILEIDMKRFYDHIDKLLCSSVNNGPIADPLSFIPFYVSTSSINGFSKYDIDKNLFGNQPNTKLTIYKNNFGYYEAFISSWAGNPETNYALLQPLYVSFISHPSFLQGFITAFQQSQIPLTNDSSRVDGCGDYRIKAGIGNPKGQWWQFARGVIEDVRTKETGEKNTIVNILPTLSPLKQYFKDNFEKALAKQFPELKLGFYKIDRETIKYGLYPVDYQKLNYYIDGGCNAGITQKGNYNMMSLYEKAMSQMTNPPIYQNSNIDGFYKAAAARSFVNYITSSCIKNNYGDPPAQHTSSTPICIGTCYTPIIFDDGIYVAFWPLEDLNEFSSYNGKCNSDLKPIKFFIQVDEQVCSHDSNPTLIK